MSQSAYRYQLEEELVIIEDLRTGCSIYAELEQVLDTIEADIGSIAGKRIICEGQDGFWDLIVPTTQGKPVIYPLNALSPDEAKLTLCHMLGAERPR